MQQLKHNLTNNNIWPIIMPMAVMAFAIPLHQYLEIPVLFTNLLAGLLLIVWFVFYAFGVWRKSIRDKKIFAEKIAAAEEQLFGTK